MYSKLLVMRKSTNTLFVKISNANFQVKFLCIELENSKLSLSQLRWLGNRLEVIKSELFSTNGFSVRFANCWHRYAMSYFVRLKTFTGTWVLDTILQSGENLTLSNCMNCEQFLNTNLRLFWRLIELECTDYTTDCPNF